MPARPVRFTRYCLLSEFQCSRDTTHDDVIKWKYFRVTGPLSPHKGQWRGALMFSLIYAWTNGWVNSRDAGNLRHNSAQYDVSVMWNMVRALLSFVVVWCWSVFPFPLTNSRVAVDLRRHICYDCVHETSLSRNIQLNDNERSTKWDSNKWKCLKKYNISNT